MSSYSDSESDETNYHLVDKLKYNKVAVEYDEDELRYIKTPTGFAAYEYETESSGSEEEEVSFDYAEESTELQFKPEKNHPEYSFSRSDEDSSLLPEEEPDELSESVENIKETPEPAYTKTVIYNEPGIPRHRQKVECELCGSVVSKGNFASHRRTNKCRMYANAGKKLVKILRS